MALALLVIGRIATAQVASARLEGTVRDPSGAVIPGSGMSVVNSRTGVRNETSTSAEGFFVLWLPPGFYKLTVESTGFRKTEIAEIEQTVGATKSQDVTLHLGSVSESIEVQAAAVRVQSADAQIALAVTMKDINILPQLGRGPMTLGLFTAGVQTDPADPTLSRVNGTRQGSNIAKLDGIEMGDSVTPRLLMGNNAVNTDSIEELRVVTSGGKAEYGRVSGGQIQLVTRVRTNEWHGNLFEYHRNTALNANSFFGNNQNLPRPKYIQNTFGGSVGGPIRRGRTFIFGNYQGRRTSQEALRNRNVLTPQARAGLFRWKNPVTGELRSFDIVQNDPRGKKIDPMVAENLKPLPDLNVPGSGDGLNTGIFRFNNPAQYTLDDMINDTVSIKADHTLRSGHRLSFRYTRGHPWIIDSITNNDARYPGQPSGTQGGYYWSYSLGSDWAITPRLMNELRVGHKYYSWDWIRPARLPGPMLLSNSWTDPLNPAFGSSRKTPLHMVTDNFTIVRGGHIFKIGMEGRFTSEWIPTTPASGPMFTSILRTARYLLPSAHTERGSSLTRIV